MGIGMGGMDSKVLSDLVSAQRMGGRAQVTHATSVSGSPGDLHEVEISNGDQVHLSSAASLAAQASTLPGVRMDKVAAMQLAIANGYHVNASDVASAMMTHAQQG